MKKLIVIMLALVLCIALAACGGGSGGGGGSSDSGGGDPLKGSWEGTYEDGDAALTFDGKGKCTLTTFFLDKEPGTYTITSDGNVDIELNIWDEALEYSFSVNEDSLTLTAKNGYSPNYDLLRKQPQKNSGMYLENLT